MVNWRTTLLGAISAVLLVVGPHLADPKKPWISMDQIPAAIGVLGLGSMAKDKNVTGGTIASTPEAFNRVEGIGEAGPHAS